MRYGAVVEGAAQRDCPEYMTKYMNGPAVCPLSMGAKISEPEIQGALRRNYSSHLEKTHHASKMNDEIRDQT